MEVSFVRTGERRYAIRVRRPGEGEVAMDPAPGYDRLFPHDLLHLVVEAVLGLGGGIFGQLASGGLAGTFRVVEAPGAPRRDASRARRRADRRDAVHARAGRDDAARSERASYLCWQAWLARSGDAGDRATAREMAETAAEIRATAPPGELDALDPPTMDRVCRHLDAFSARWRDIPVGEAVTLGWPDLELLGSPGTGPATRGVARP